MRASFFILIFLFLGLTSKSQLFEEYDHSISYLGISGINPGLKYSLETPWWDTDYQERLFLPFGKSSINWELSGAYYWDPFSHTAFFNNLELNYRQYLGTYLGLQMGIGAGYAIFFTNDNFVVRDNGVTKRAINARMLVGPHLSLGSFIGGRNQEKRLFTRIIAQALVPNNTSILPLFSLELGYQF